jgi:hypothetical protein
LEPLLTITAARAVVLGGGHSVIAMAFESSWHPCSDSMARVVFHAAVWLFFFSSLFLCLCLEKGIAQAKKTLLSSYCFGISDLVLFFVFV